MRVLVTGAAGRLGRAVVAELEARDHDTVGVDLSVPRGSPHLAVDLRDAGETYGMVARVRPEAIIHLAGIAVPFSLPEHTLFGINTATTFHVCQAAADLGVHTVLCASSPTVIGYGNPAGWMPERLPIDETHPVRPWHAYAMAKVAGEQVIRGFAARMGDSARFLSFRPCYVVAPEDWAPGAATTLGHSMADRLRRPELGAVSLFNYVDARDAATLAALICEESVRLRSGDLFFCGAADALAQEPLAELLPRFHPESAALAVNLRGTTPAFSNAKATAELGWTPRYSWRTELAEAL